MEGPSVCAIVLGITGAGKSTFLNNFAFAPKRPDNPKTQIKVPQIFETFDIDSYTKIGKAETINIDGKRLDIIDIPGINGTFEKEWILDHYSSMVKKYCHISKVFLVQNLYRPELNSTLRYLFEIFGPTVLPHVHIVFTRVDDYINSKVDESDISKNHGIVQRAIWRAYSEFFEECQKNGLPYQMKSYSCVTKDFSNNFYCDMFAEIDYVRSLVKDSLELTSDRYNVNHMCYSKSKEPCYLKLPVFELYIEKFNRLELEQKNIAAQVQKTESSWWILKPQYFFKNSPCPRVTFETYNSVFSLYFDLMFCIKSWYFVEKQLRKQDNISFCEKETHLEKMETTLRQANMIIKKIIGSCHLFVTCLENGLLICKNVKRCDHCGAVWGNVGGCSSRVCGANYDRFDIKTFGKRQNGKIDVVSVACGNTYNWATARPLYLHELVGFMDLNDLQMVFSVDDEIPEIRQMFYDLRPENSRKEED